MTAIPKINKGEEAFLFWCKALRMPIPERNYRFHPTRKWEIDWCWPSIKAGAEINGGIFSNGAHARPMNIIRDMAKHNALLDMGWRVWHFTPAEVIDGEVVQLLRDKLFQGEST